MPWPTAVTPDRVTLASWPDPSTSPDIFILLLARSFSSFSPTSDSYSCCKVCTRCSRMHSAARATVHSSFDYLLPARSPCLTPSDLARWGVARPVRNPTCVRWWEGSYKHMHHERCCMCLGLACYAVGMAVGSRKTK
jgi:hypothetical protein